MTSLGHILLLVAFVTSGYAATACLGSDRDVRGPLRGQRIAGLAAFISLTLACGVLAYALIVKDFRFAYVAQYSDDLLAWHYSLSALWVGQAGSLLLWGWLSGAVALVFLSRARAGASSGLQARAFGIQMAMICFLTAIMVFAADPMQASIVPVPNGVGLNPVLQHPVMLIHPPIVFLGYALWAVPFSLALATLIGSQIDAKWLRTARSWSLAAWMMLGIGILLGANWAYEELGWGGYWAWDPVENGSLIPWLTGTVFIHAMMSWQYRGILKKTCLASGLATFGLCQFAAFLTRSGLFSSMHAFSQSAIGWLFLVLMAAIVVGGSLLIVRARRQLAPDRRIESVFSREAFGSIALVALLMLTAVTILGTVMAPLSGILLPTRVAVGPAFYNNVLVPVGLVLAITTSVVPLLRWGEAPDRLQRRILIAAAFVVIAGLIGSLALTERHPLETVVIGLAALTVVALVSQLVIDSSRRTCGKPVARILDTLATNRRQYSGFVIHAAFMMAVVGISWSSLGAMRHDVEMAEGSRIEFAGYSIHYSELREDDRPDKLEVEAELDVTADDGTRFTLSPAQHYHHHQEEWTTEVAIHSTWGRDFYAIVHDGEKGRQANFSFLINPMMRWLWGAGWLSAFGVALRFWPARRRVAPPEVDGRAHSHRRVRLRRLSSRRTKAGTDA